MERRISDLESRTEALEKCIKELAKEITEYKIDELRLKLKSLEFKVDYPTIPSYPY